MSEGQRGWRPSAPRARYDDEASDYGSSAPPQRGAPEPASQRLPPTPQPPVQANPPSRSGVERGVTDGFGPPSAWAPGRRENRFEVPAIEEERPKRPLPVKGLLVGLVGIVMLGIVVGIAFVNLRPNAISSEVLAKPTATASNQVRAQSPQEIVEAYFGALQSGDISRALAMGPRGGTGSERLLTPTAFKETSAESKISDLEILTQQVDATRVEVRYTLAGSSVTALVELDRLDTGEYQLKRTTVPIQITAQAVDGIPLLVNGQELDHSQIYEAVPGVYDMSTGLPFISYGETSRFTVTTLEQTDVKTIALAPQLTSAGRDAFIDAASTAIDACLATKAKSPANCPIRMAANAPVDESTIRRVLDSDPWMRARASLSASDQSAAEVTVTLSYKLSYHRTDGGRQEGSPEEKVVTARASMLGTTKEQIIISWIE